MENSMTATILDGKALAEEIRAEIAGQATEFTKQTGVAPCLAAVLVGENPASQVYVRAKQKACQQTGLTSQLHRPAADASTEELLRLIDRLNRDPAVLAGLLADNEFAEPKISGVTIDAMSEAGERRLRIVDAALVSRRVAPGSDLVATVRLADRRGSERTEVVRLEVPHELPDGRATLVVGDGNAISGLRLALEPGEPRSLEDLRRFVERIVPADRLGAALVVSGRGAVTGSSTLTSLPPSAAAILGDGQRGDSLHHSLGSRIVTERLVVLDRPVTGSVRLEFEIERPRS